MTLNYDFTAQDLASMREAQYGHMQDSGYFQALTRTYNSYGEEVNFWTDIGSEISCGLEMMSGSEIQASDKTIVEYDAVLRVAINELPSELYRFRVTKRHKESLATPLVFDIVSPVQRGVSGNRILLKKVST